MAMRPPGSKNTLKRRYGGALAAVTAVLMLAACDPSATGAGAVTPSASVGVAGTVSATPSVAPTSASPSASPTPSADPTTAPPAARATTQAPAATKPAAAPPAPTRTRTAAPAPEPTQAKENAGCYPLSNAGNCYKAGQICRKADIGSTGRDANGRAIHCRQDSSVGQRWGY
ncbi:hypothetical protein MRQ86_29640 [Streptomyces sp. MMS21 TC-5]|uniref:hypothetical protein n=1 Tax=Streptomyces TaxID=1883 RepID=UPI00056CCF93|nr:MULTISPECIES: hypothetical protein [Streptomyces]MCI4084400.1 hypothetical protein [Streptomyces sp. MMS21 TC-5]